jgi:RNA polymerase sigma-70 factor (ECF subfamily)
MAIENKLNPGEWVEKHGDYLYNFAYSRVFVKELAEDLVQETFLSALSALKSFEGRGKESTWLTSILKNKIIDHYRKNSRAPIHQSIDEAYDSPFREDKPFKGHWEKDRIPRNWIPEGQKNLEKKDFEQALDNCLEKLPEHHAACFSLKVIEEMATKEICKELKISPSNLWVILHRARVQLRECLESTFLDK